MIEESFIKDAVQGYFEDKSSSQELEMAFSLFENPYQNLVLRKILFEIWNEQEHGIKEQLQTKDFSDILDKIHHQINLNQKVKKIIPLKIWLFNGLKIAAILILGLVLGLMINNFKKPETVYYTSIAPNGSVSEMMLPDSTIVFLNSGSELKYTINNSLAKREVFLEGEAWFQVAKDEKKQFVVHTPYYDINVVGTEFNVKAYRTDEEIVTTLEKGSIQITTSEKISMENNTVLKPGEQLVYNQIKNTLEIRNVNPRYFTSWKDNKLIFINMGLKELITLMERKFGVDINVSDNAILDYHYDGTIKNETLFEMLDLLRETLPIKYKIDGQTILIIKK